MCDVIGESEIRNHSDLLKCTMPTLLAHFTLKFSVMLPDECILMCDVIGESEIRNYTDQLKCTMPTLLAHFTQVLYCVT